MGFIGDLLGVWNGILEGKGWGDGETESHKVNGLKPAPSFLLQTNL